MHLNVRAKSVKLLGENVGLNLSVFELGNGFLDIAAKYK